MSVLKRVEFKGKLECACGAAARTASIGLDNHVLAVFNLDCGRVGDSGCVATVCMSCDGRCDNRRNAGGKPDPSVHVVCCLCFHRGVDAHGTRNTRWDLWGPDDLCEPCAARYAAEDRERKEADLS